MDTSKAEALLLEIQKIDTIIAYRREEVEKLQASIDGTPTTAFRTDRVQFTHEHDKRGRQLAELVDLEKELAEEVATLCRKRQNYIRELEKLNQHEYAVLYKRYVQGKDFNKIADELDRSYSWATSMHSRAKQSLQRLLTS